MRFGDENDSDSLARVMGRKAVKLSINYLGLPVGPNFKEVSMWDLVVNKF